MVEQDLIHLQETSGDSPEHVISQHNALINASFALKPLELRLFLAMLKRLRYGDSEFKEYFIPTDELTDTASGGTAYRNIKAMADGLTAQVLKMESIDTYGTRPKTEAWKDSSWLRIPLMGIAYYEKGSGGIKVSFNHRLMPYLIDLKGNFTQASLQQLTLCRGVYSYRIYLLLREYGRQGKRTMSIAELRFKLGIGPEEYAGRFNNFKARVLDTAQEQLAKTDMPFAYTILKEGRKLTGIEFRFKPVSATKEPLQVRDGLGEKWADYLLDNGIHQSDIGKVAVLLKSNKHPNYTLDYLSYVIDYIAGRIIKGKVSSPSGMLREAVVNQMLMGGYEKLLKGKGLLKTLPLMQTTLELGERIPREDAPEPEKKPLPPAVEPEEEVMSMEQVGAIYDDPATNFKKGYANLQVFCEAYMTTRGNWRIDERDGQQVLVRPKGTAGALANRPSARPGKEILRQLG